MSASTCGELVELALQCIDIGGIFCGRIGGLAAIQYLTGQRIRYARAKQAFLTAIECLHRPWRVEHILDEAMVAEWHPDLQTHCHADSIFTIEQDSEVASQMEIAQLAHPGFDCILLEQRHLLDRFVIAGLRIAYEVQAGDKSRIEDLEPGFRARHMSEVNPGKCVSVPRLRLMQPFVTAEYFVCRFARQCHGRLIADRSEE